MQIKKIRSFINFSIVMLLSVLALKGIEQVLDSYYDNADGSIVLWNFSRLANIYALFIIEIIVFFTSLHFLSFLKNSFLKLTLGYTLSLVLFLFLIEFTLQQFNFPNNTDQNYIKAGWRSLDIYPIERVEHVNQLGFRGQKIEYEKDDFVVILLGDSQTEAIACNFQQMPERKLEERLKEFNPKSKVFSIGAGGYGTDQQLLALEEYFGKYRANMVLLWQTIDNDIWNNIFPTAWPKDGWIKPTFWLEKENLKGPNYKIGDRVCYLGNNKNVLFKLQLLFNKLFYYKNYKTEKGRDAEWDKKLPKAYIATKNFSGDYIEWDNFDHPFKYYENFTNEKTHFSVGLTPKSKRMDYGIKLTQKILKEIATICEKNKAEFKIFYPLVPEKGRIHPSGVYKWKNQYYIHTLEQISAIQNDLNSPFKKIVVPMNLENWKVGKYDAHLNPNANQEVMYALGDSIIQRIIKESL